MTETPTAATLTNRLNAAERDRSFAPVAIRDAATLIILDPAGRSVLMGRRSHKHVFMPGQFVFPGGRVDTADLGQRVVGRYREATLNRLMRRGGKRMTPARARAFGVAALRETWEETGQMIGRPFGPLPRGDGFSAFAERNLALDLSQMSFIARAITPPGRPRRFDTRFFAVPRAAIATEDPSRLTGDMELEEIAWIPMEETRDLDLPAITVTILDELAARLEHDPTLSADLPVPFYRWLPRGFVREHL